MDREYAQPLDVDSLARGVNMSAGHLSREFRRAYVEGHSGGIRVHASLPCPAAAAGMRGRAQARP